MTNVLRRELKEKQMYRPVHFREDDPGILQQFIQQHSFGVLIAQRKGKLVANHLPFLLDTGCGIYGVLRGHMARANNQWHMLGEGDPGDTREVLVIFQGPHSYVSPSWYVDDVETSVPTWNYAAVHAYGVPRLIEDSTELSNILLATVQTNEAQFAHPWQVELLNEHVQKKLKAIVGFEIEITRLEGKFKLSQNRSMNDQQEVITALDQSLSPETAQLMRQRLEK